MDDHPDQAHEPATDGVATVPEDRDLLGESEEVEGVEQINPLQGLGGDPDDRSTPAGDADAPAPFG